MLYGQGGRQKCQHCGKYPKNMKNHRCQKMGLAELEKDLENPEKIEEMHSSFVNYLNQGQLEL